MKQTAVEWLVIQLHTHWENEDVNFEKLIEQAKQMEKEQIIDAFVECWKANMPDGFDCKLDAEQYYNETFKQ
tara:strand:+ start:485 stop:700 length:216 start_codon:yes stop_codon:yes gene_type:complete